MSHHVSASATNPTGAVEVVHVASSGSTAAPVDTGSASAGTPVSTVSGGGQVPAQSSGTPGANLPVDNIQQASNTIEGGRADLSRTTGAERRLDGFDGVGGGGGGAAAGGDAGQQNANNATGAPAQGTAQMVTDSSGAGGVRTNATPILDTSAASQETQSSVRNT